MPIVPLIRTTVMPIRGVIGMTVMPIRGVIGTTVMQISGVISTTIVRIASAIKNGKEIRPIYRAPLGHMLFYCQGALFPWPDKTCNQFPIQFFTISRRNHSKWFCCYINHTSGHALSLKQTMNRPLIPDSYPFLLSNSMLCTKISLHKGN